MADERAVDVWTRPGEAVRLFLRGATARTACPTAVVVGTILAGVNQAPVIAGGRATAGTWVQVAINYVIPFVVASVGYLAARRARVGEGPGGERNG